MDNDSFMDVVLGLGALAVAVVTVAPILASAFNPAPPDSDE